MSKTIYDSYFMEHIREQYSMKRDAKDNWYPFRADEAIRMTFLHSMFLFLILYGFTIVPFTLSEFDSFV